MLWYRYVFSELEEYVYLFYLLCYLSQILVVIGLFMGSKNIPKLVYSEICEKLGKNYRIYENKNKILNHI